MNFLKSNNNNCRMCLEDNANLNWNEELFDSPGVSYKDCYYKYTQMEEIDIDSYPTKFCLRCAEGIRNAHRLFEKAVRSFIILQNTYAKDNQAFNVESYNNLDNNYSTENFMHGRADMDIDEVICYSPVQDDNQEDEQYSVPTTVGSTPRNELSLTRPTISDVTTVGSHSKREGSTIAAELLQKEDEYKKVVAQMQDRNCRSLKSSCGSPTEKEALGSFDIKLLMSKVDKEQIRKDRYLEALNMALELKLQLKISDKKLWKSLAYKNGTKNYNFSSQNLLDNQQNSLLTSKNGKGSTVEATSSGNLKHKGQSVMTDISRRRTSLKDKLNQRNTLFNHSSSNKIVQENINLEQLNAENNQQTSKALNMPLLNPVLDQSSTNSLEFSNPAMSQNEALKISLSEELDKTNTNDSILEKYQITETTETSQNEPLKISLSEKHDIFNTNDSNLEKAQITLETTSAYNKEVKSYKPYEIVLLKKIYGDDFDIETKKLKTKPKCLKPKEKICQYCSLVVLGINKLLLHEATHLRKGRTEACPKCGVKFFSKEVVKEHLKTHDENRKLHKCGYCEKTFYNVGSRNVHQRIHLGLMVKCPICPKEFFRQIDVDKHLPSHSIEKLSGPKKIKHKVFCQDCKKYINSSTWKAHKAAHLKEPQLKCKICDREFYARTSCIKHIREKHGKKGDCNQYIHYFNKIRMSHLLLRQQEVVEVITK